MVEMIVVGDVGESGQSTSEEGCRPSRRCGAQSAAGNGHESECRMADTP